MEDDHRPFQAVSIDMASTETGAERFMIDGWNEPPPTAHWRCNLTALSRRYNLYFVASRSGIAVYQPSFPFQKLKRTPKLYVVPTVANVEARGYIDERHPHSINHLVVGDLGSEEILLVATDSGSVTAYHTRSIRDAIKKDPYRFSDNARSDFVGLRAFFSQWVKESAWGLAIHQEARMIAVSANAPHPSRLRTSATDRSANVTVFAFALTEQGSDDSEDEYIVDVEAGLGDSEWTDWSVGEFSADSPPRDRNYKVVLGGNDGHQFNIPSISFVNTSSDSQGVWLLSTDISGGMKLWQIWKRRCRTSWQLPEDAEDPPDHLIHDESGWMVAALDPASFREASTMEQFCGHHTAKKYIDTAGESYDLSDIVKATIPGRSERHIVMPGSDDDDDEDAEDGNEIADYFSEAGSGDEETDSHQTTSASNVRPSGARDVRAPDETEELQVPLTPNRADNHVMTAVATNAIQRDIEELLLDHYDSELEDSDENFDQDSRTGEGDEEELSDDDDDDSSEFSGSVASRTSFSNVSQRSSVEVELGPMTLTLPDTSRPSPVDSIEVAKAKKRRRTQTTEALAETPIPRIPVLHCSSINVRLFDAPRERVPHVFCHDPLQQQLPLLLRGPHGHMRRLNMFHQIPELGVILIGSQLGRMAVCALTRNRQTGTLGLRMDWLLPTKRQERAGQRPNCFLLGIAAAPIQGHQLQPPLLAADDDRWGRDSNADGVKVSFDPGVFVLPEARWPQDPSNSDEEPPGTRATKRHRRMSAASMSSSSAASTQQRPWARPQPLPTYQPMENSRRYRVMMTYQDFTVLTYEISRDVGREDVAGVFAATE